MPVLSACFLAAIVSGPASGKINVCSTSKIRASGKTALRLAICHAKAVRGGVPLDLGCAQKARDRVAADFGRAESKDPQTECLTTDDAAAISGKVDAFVDELRAAVGAFAAGPSRCDSSKLKAAGKKTRAKARCLLVQGAGAILASDKCLGKADGKFAGAVARAEGRDDCSATGQATALEDLVDAFLDDLSSELAPPGTPTTTVPATTTTTTTFVPVPCGELSYIPFLRPVPVCSDDPPCPDGGQCRPHQGPLGWMCACYPPDVTPCLEFDEPTCSLRMR